MVDVRVLLRTRREVGRAIAVYGSGGAVTGVCPCTGVVMAFVGTVAAVVARIVHVGDLVYPRSVGFEVVMAVIRGRIGRVLDITITAIIPYTEYRASSEEAGHDETEPEYEVDPDADAGVDGRRWAAEEVD